MQIYTQQVNQFKIISNNFLVVVYRFVDINLINVYEDGAVYLAEIVTTTYDYIIMVFNNHKNIFNINILINYIQNFQKNYNEPNTNKQIINVVGSNKNILKNIYEKCYKYKFTLNYVTYTIFWTQEYLF